MVLSQSDEAKFVHRVDMVNLVLSGIPVSVLSAATNDSINSITGWVKKADEIGFESLRAKKQPGRPSKLTKDQLSEIKTAIESEPENYGFRVWDGPSLSRFVKDRYGVHLGVRQCQRIFNALGFSLVRPQTFPCPKKDSQARIAFKKN